MKQEFTKNSHGGNGAVTNGQTAGRTNDEARRFLNSFPDASEARQQIHRPQQTNAHQTVRTELIRLIRARQETK